MKRIAALVIALAIACLSVAPAAAQAAQVNGPSDYTTATPPTKGALYLDGQDGRWLLGGQWLGEPDPQDQGLGAGWWRSGAASANWTPITVPSSYNAGDFSPASMNGSVYWYRREFLLPAGAFPSSLGPRARRWIVRFESVNYRATVWLNGRQLTSHTGAYLPFEAVLTGLHAGANELIVRVDDRRSPTDTPPGPGGGWWTFGGIQREVYLRAVAAVDISSARVRPLLPCPTCAATIDELATLTNLSAATRTVRLTGSYGGLPIDFGSFTIRAGASVQAHATLTLPQPHLWTLSDPYLYRARLTLSDGAGRRLGGYTVESGVRSIAVDADGRLELNGHTVQLRGVNVHEQDVTEGAALDPGKLAQLVGWAKLVGAGIIRAHYPLSPLIEQLADHEGILLWSEVPVYQLSGQALAAPGVIAQADSLVQQNIVANENHPSVAIWSIGNELQTPPPGPEAVYIARAAALAHQLDPTRPVGLAISSWPGVACQQAYWPLDVIGYNDYFGWYDAGAGATDDRAQLGPYLDSLRTCYPTQALMVTEFGFEANRHGPADERGTYEFQADALSYHLGVFDQRPWLSGAVYFALQDFAAHPGWGGGDPYPNPPYVQKGVVDQYGNVKPNFGLMQSLFTGVQQVSPEWRSAHHRSRQRP